MRDWQSLSHVRWDCKYHLAVSIHRRQYSDIARPHPRRVKNRHCGAQGMTAEQVLRAAITKQIEGFSYEALAFHLIDSRTYRNF